MTGVPQRLLRGVADAVADEGPKQNAEHTPLLVLGAVLLVSNPALVLARGVHVTRTPLVAPQAAFASPNTARVVKSGV